MKINKIIITSIFALAICFIPMKNVYAGIPITGFTISQTDASSHDFLVYYFDLRDRETFIQLTYFENFAQGLSANMHIQIFDVSNNCNENDFFDVYTPNDTHVYNMRDIQTNDGNPSGVVLPDGGYGIVVVTFFPTAQIDWSIGLIGNMRILDDNGYEYRTNAQVPLSNSIQTSPPIDPNRFYSFNFNQEEGVVLSDIIGITLDERETEFGFEFIAEPLEALYSLDVDIYDLNEVPFSCRDVIFSCVDEDNPVLQTLLESVGTANVASFEYGINNAIPHSRGSELLCPGNVVGDGIVVLRPEFQEAPVPIFTGFVGLNNGNQRGSFDSIWIYYQQIFAF